MHVNIFQCDQQNGKFAILAMRAKRLGQVEVQTKDRGKKKKDKARQKEWETKHEGWGGWGVESVSRDVCRVD